MFVLGHFCCSQECMQNDRDLIHSAFKLWRVYGKPIVVIFNTKIQFQFNEIQFQFNEIQVQFNEIQFQFNGNSMEIQWKLN